MIAAKVDANQTLIVGALRSYGASVQSLAKMGQGCPDLLVGYRGANYLIEIKNPKNNPAKRELRETQERWHALWRGQVATVETVDEAFDVLAAPQGWTA